MKRHTIVGIGEILWDVFPNGPKFGGAPANFACSAAGLGRERVGVFVASGVGNDDFGRRALEFLQKRGVDTSCVAVQDQATGQVDVELDDAGRASYRFAADTAWDNLVWSNDMEQLAARTDAVCFGTLGQRSEQSRATIRQFVSATPSTAIRILDVNLRPPFVSDAVIRESIELANVLKLNDEELPVVAELCGASGTEFDVMREISSRLDIEVVAVTRGPQGAVLVRGEEISEFGGVQANVVDTVGAGDAFTAALVLGLLTGSPLDEINQTACNVAAFVCSQSGATPALPDIHSFASGRDAGSDT